LRDSQPPIFRVRRRQAVGSSIGAVFYLLPRTKSLRRGEQLSAF